MKLLSKISFLEMFFSILERTVGKLLTFVFREIILQVSQLNKCLIDNFINKYEDCGSILCGAIRYQKVKNMNK